MSNNQFVLETFNKSLYSYQSFKTQLPSLFIQLQKQNSKFNNALLDNINKILSSKYSGPSQKFYALYSLLKCIEARNQTFIDDLAQKDELIATILNISQTDMEKSEAEFTRGTNFFSAKPSRGQAKAGINIVKLSIEILCYLGQTWGEKDKTNPRSVFPFLVDSLKDKMTIPTMIWFINKDYAVPENRELYCWNFNRKSPKVISEGPKFVLEDQKAETISELQVKAEAIRELNLLDTPEKVQKKEAKVETKSRSEIDLLTGEEIQKQPDVEKDQDDDLKPKQPAIFGLGLQERKDGLKQSSKVASEPAKGEEKNIENERPTVLSDFLKNQNKASDNVKVTENNKRSLNSSSYTGILISTPRDGSPAEHYSKEQKEDVSAKKGLFKTTESRGLPKEAVWVFDDYSRLSAGEDENHENILLERKANRAVTFNPTQSQRYDIKEKRQSLLGRANTFTANTDMNKPKDKKINTREKMNLEAGIRSTPALKEISPVVNSKFVGPKHIEERLSPTFLSKSKTMNINMKGQKSSKLEKELLEIENSIKKSMQRTPITPKNYGPPLIRAQSMRTAASIPEKITVVSEEKAEEDFPGVNYLPFSTAKIRDTKLAVSKEFVESTGTKRKLNFSSVSKSEANNPNNAAKIGPVSNFEEKISKWKSIVVEKTNPANQGNIRQQLKKEVPQPKMHPVKDLKEIEDEDDSDKENIFKVPTPRTSPEKKNLKPKKQYREGDKAESKQMPESMQNKPVSDKRAVGRKLRNF